MTTNDDLIAHARSLIPALAEQMSALPDDGDLATPNAQRRNADLRLTLQSHGAKLRDYIGELAEATPNLDADRLWLDILRACQLEFERALAHLESLPPDERQKMSRHEEALRWSLRIVQFGPESGRSEVMPPFLYSWLESHGAQPEDGRFFNGRGGLLHTDARIKAMEGEGERARAKARANLERTIAGAEKLLPTPIASATA